MGKGSRHRRERREAEEKAQAEARAAADEKARRDAFFATWSPEDDDEGPAFPCPECGAFGRRWATPEERTDAIAAHDAEWKLAPVKGDDRKVAVCPTCGHRAVLG